MTRTKARTTTIRYGMKERHKYSINEEKGRRGEGEKR
jgi:hypothetical protein